MLFVAPGLSPASPDLKIGATRPHGGRGPRPEALAVPFSERSAIRAVPDGKSDDRVLSEWPRK